MRVGGLEIRHGTGNSNSFHQRKTRDCSDQKCGKNHLNKDTPNGSWPGGEERKRTLVTARKEGSASWTVQLLKGASKYRTGARAEKGQKE